MRIPEARHLSTKSWTDGASVALRIHAAKLPASATTKRFFPEASFSEQLGFVRDRREYSSICSTCYRAGARNPVFPPKSRKHFDLPWNTSRNRPFQRSERIQLGDSKSFMNAEFGGLSALRTEKSRSSVAPQHLLFDRRANTDHDGVWLWPR
jgi:hypothetical protein